MKFLAVSRSPAVLSCFFYILHCSVFTYFFAACGLLRVIEMSLSSKATQIQVCLTISLWLMLCVCLFVCIQGGKLGAGHDLLLCA